jgi:hypothetical protein
MSRGGVAWRAPWLRGGRNTQTPQLAISSTRDVVKGQTTKGDRDCTDTALPRYIRDESQGQGHYHMKRRDNTQNRLYTVKSGMGIDTWG